MTPGHARRAFLLCEWWQTSSAPTTPGLSCISPITLVLLFSPFQGMHGYLFHCARKELRPQCACLSSEIGIPPQPGMTHHDAAPADKGMPEEESIHLALPGLLPEHHILVLNPEKRIVVLLHNKPDGETRSVREQTFTPSAMRILITLLQAYPHYCRYEVLLAQLYPISVEEGRRQLQQAREPTMRPLRRAIGSLTAALQPFGLRVCSIRRVGFVLQPLV